MSTNIKDDLMSLCLVFKCYLKRYDKRDAVLYLHPKARSRVKPTRDRSSSEITTDVLYDEH